MTNSKKITKRLFKNYSFNKEPDEKIIFMFRKHWVIITVSFIKALISLILFFLAIFLIGPSRVFNSIILSCILGIWLVVTLVYVSYEWLVWYLDLYILTDKRVIDIEQRTLFSRSISETTLDKIQDVTYEIHGFLATFFNYGNIKIETAGKETVISLDQIKDPEHIQKTIFHLTDSYNKKGE